MTTANKITILRILLVPFFVVQMIYYEEGGEELNRLLAILSFAIAAISDGVDGYIARRYNQRSELGAVLDPLADKLLLVSAIILLTIPNRNIGNLPLWLTATVVGRDVIILIGLVVIYYAVGKVNVRPRLTGKAATVLQMISVLWALLKWPVNWAFVWALAAAVCTGLSGIFYVFDGVGQLSRSPSSSPAPKQTHED
ncbi:MAG: CDP-alcohol phosphatidyltransferase family protein [Verrucomicrobia bacterium]|nr:CDP-alcohol phosphatidyltransferase family protein [Verrucomicrobiota bacterium]